MTDIEPSFSLSFHKNTTQQRQITKIGFPYKRVKHGI